MEDSILDHSEQIQLRPAGFWHRAAALIIDVILLGIIGFAIQFAVAGTAVFNQQAQAERLGIEVPTDPSEMGSYFMQLQLKTFTLPETYLNFALFLFYFGFFEASASGGTLGKMAVGLKVVNENGGQLTTGQGFTRAFARLLVHGFSTMLCCLTGFTYLTALGDSKKSPLDMLAKTQVVFK